LDKAQKNMPRVKVFIKDVCAPFDGLGSQQIHCFLADIKTGETLCECTTETKDPLEFEYDNKIQCTLNARFCTSNVNITLGSVLLPEENGNHVCTLSHSNPHMQNTKISVLIEGFVSCSSNTDGQYPETLKNANIVLGPMLKFEGQSPEGLWKVSALVVTNAIRPDTPRIVLNPEQIAPDDDALFVVEGELFYQTMAGPEYNFWRFDLTTPCRPVERVVQYQIEGMTFEFMVPATNANSRYGFATCNGYLTGHDKAKATSISNMWRKMLKARLDIHFLVLGGDAIYSDGYVGLDADEPENNDDSQRHLWYCCEELRQWYDLDYTWNPDKVGPSTTQKLQTPFSDTMHSNVYTYAVNLYLRQFTQRWVWIAFATCPVLYSWDDHETHDGAGSDLIYNNSLVGKGLRDLYRELYFAFLNQRNVSEAIPVALKIDAGRTLLLLPDTRSDRTTTQILGAHTWKELTKAISNLQNVNSVVCVLPIAPTYPQNVQSCVLISESLVRHPGILAGLCKLIHGTRRYEGPPDCRHDNLVLDLNDELLDRWTHPNHIQECIRLLNLLTTACQKNNCNLLFLSGDIHYGLIQKIRTSQNFEFLTVISSPVGNVPQNSVVPKIDTVMEKLGSPLSHPLKEAGYIDIDNVTQQMPLSCNIQRPRTFNNKTIHKRNFCVLSTDKNISITIAVENDADALTFWSYNFSSIPHEHY
jgi:hypothetical protein